MVWLETDVSIIDAILHVSLWSGHDRYEWKRLTFRVCTLDGLTFDLQRAEGGPCFGSISFLVYCIVPFFDGLLAPLK